MQVVELTKHNEQLEYTRDLLRCAQAALKEATQKTAPITRTGENWLANTENLRLLQEAYDHPECPLRERVKLAELQVKIARLSPEIANMLVQSVRADSAEQASTINNLNIQINITAPALELGSVPEK